MRLEDHRLLTGHGRFVDDLPFADALHAHILRSPHAHARILCLDVEGALAVAGVVAVYTAADLKRGGIGALPCRTPVTSRDGSPMQAPDRPVLAEEVVRFVGDGVAMVVAETAGIARDAAELIAVDYESLPACADVRESRERCFDWEKGDPEAVQAAFDRAHRTCALEVVNNRIVISPMETRSAVAEYDAESDRYTLHTQTQGVHSLRKALAESVLGVALERLRVVTNDVGGSFGMKIFTYPAQALVLYAARRLGRPVKWVGDRSDAFLTDAHGRDHFHRAEIALDAGGRFLALRAHVRANLGAYLSNAAPSIPTDGLQRVFGHVYDIPALYLRVEGMLTNTTPVDAYRGAGKPEIVTTVERLIDRAALESGIDRVTLRRINLVPASAMPYTTAFGRVYDCGDFEAAMDEALALSDWAGFAQRRRASEARGDRRGIGLGLWLHTTGGNPMEVSQVELAAESVIVRTGTQSAGQGHETVFAQLVADELQIPRERVRVIQGDTDVIATGGGTGGSSSLPIGATTIARATGQMLEQARERAADMLEAAALDMEYGDGRFTITGTDLSLGLFELGARLDHEQNGACVGESAFQGEHCTYPNGAYVCEVCIDAETGQVRIESFTCVDDLGTVLDTAIATGQVIGGVVQGIGQALLERTVYDADSAQLLSGSFMDYGLPRADDVPLFTTVLTGQPSRNNPLGVKGAGEVGPIGAPAAVANAVVDALGGQDFDMPATPERIWLAMGAAGAERTEGS
jgi:carbon-monoxide dehydrogenase large subunit